MINWIKAQWCNAMHDKHHQVVNAYSNRSHRWWCGWCGRTWDD